MTFFDFLRRSRAMFLTCTVVPVTLGGALAYYDTGRLDLLLFFLTLLGVSLAHLGVNLSNDYFDFRFGADRKDTAERPYSGGGDSLTRDRVAPDAVKGWFWLCFAGALLIGILILLLVPAGKGLIFGIMVLGFLGGYFYTAPPLRLAYRGLGELDIFLFLGPAPVVGTYAVQAGVLTWATFLRSLPVAGLIAALLWINEYTDFETDREAGKRNLVVRLGRKRARWGYALIVVSVFALVVSLVATGNLHPMFLVALIPIPLAARSIATAIFHYDDTRRIAGAQRDFLKVHLFVGLLCSVGVFIGSRL